jgi:predicted metal-dependent phosphoesterase TrpH
MDHARWGRADLHMHTNYSDGRPTVRALLDHVAQRGMLDVIAITDHDTIEGACEAQALQSRYSFDIVVGEEVSSRQGHILALFINRCVPPGMGAVDTIAAIHKQGGLAVAAHPFITTWTVGKQEVTMQGVGKLMATLPFDGIEVDNSTPFLQWANFRARRLNRRVAHKSELGNSDAHIVQAIGKSFTTFPGYRMAHLRYAIENRLTRARRIRYGSRELVAYAGFWVESTRATRKVEVAIK